MMNTSKLKSLIVMVTLTCMTLLAFFPVPTTNAYTGEGSLTQQSSWQSSDGGRNMYTDATLQRSGPLAGQLDVMTRTKNNVLLTGFTGGVFVLLRNADGAVIGVTDMQKYGVDGKWIGRYDRTDYWNWSFDPQVAAATASLQIIQQHSAKDFSDQLAYWQSVVCGNLDRLGLPKPPFGCPA
ncbi:hypothetical protein [Paenibacillus sp. GSMTC-2017]|uniref:hypothetical protein n=1 Tax=Paenibacillus sp. GSMTC-2017 TaxID=2794350 RepID=UPI001E644F1B|nr:hypothetical protein [Paenibacillus sp. GSMTC-2017]